MSDDLAFTPIRPWPSEKTQEYIMNDNLLMLKLGKWKFKMVEIVSDEDFRAQGLTAPGWEELNSSSDSTESNKSNQSSN
jgi:tyrosyl-tRNA synthetase